jgi:hypothetical protein
MESNITREDLFARGARRVTPGEFEPSRHFYQRAMNAQVHPLVAFFMRLSTERIVSRYCHLNPGVVADQLSAILHYEPKFLRWAGADLFHVTSEAGNRQMVVVETNSCPSGNKSMPILSDDQEEGGFRSLLQRCLVPQLAGCEAGDGDLAVLYDKNLMEASGYAAALAEILDEPVWLAPFAHGHDDPPARFDDGVLWVRDSEDRWHKIRSAMRYVTQRPWNRIPVYTRTQVLNPIIACLAGGRNKLVAAKAYDLYNAELMRSGLEIHTPETIRDLSKAEIPLWVRRFGGNAVVKVPYANAGQGVFTIVGEGELRSFMDSEQKYERYVVQSLIGNHEWSSMSRRGRLYHVGTVPDKRGDIYVADLRMMVVGGEDGFRPQAIYARRARTPLRATASASSSWEVLGTNLSAAREDGGWQTDTERLMLMDRRDFNQLGLGLDELIEAYIQTVLSVVAIDRLAGNLINSKGRLSRKLFRSLCDDDVLLGELLE